MIDKLKQWGALIAEVLVAILGFLLFRQTKKTQAAEDALAVKKTNEGVLINDKDKEQAKKEADRSVSDYDALKRAYDSSKPGGIP